MIFQHGLEPVLIHRILIGSEAILENTGREGETKILVNFSFLFQSYMILIDTNISRKMLGITEMSYN